MPIPMPSPIRDGSVTGTEGYDDTSYTYSVSGADHRFFAFDNAGTLSFRDGPTSLTSKIRARTR